MSPHPQQIEFANIRITGDKNHLCFMFLLSNTNSRDWCDIVLVPYHPMSRDNVVNCKREDREETRHDLQNQIIMEQVHKDKNNALHKRVFTTKQRTS